MFTPGVLHPREVGRNGCLDRRTRAAAHERQLGFALPATGRENHLIQGA